MTAVLDINHSVLVDLRTHIVVVLGNVGKRCNTSSRQEPCAVRWIRSASPAIVSRTVTEKIVFQRIQFILRTENRVLEFFQTRGDVALRIRQASVFSYSNPGQDP